MTKLTDERIKVVEEALVAECARLGKKLGLVLSTHGPFLRTESANFSVRIAGTLAPGVPDCAAARAFARAAPKVGLTVADYGKRFVYAGKVYKVERLNLGARKYKVVAAREPDGKRFVFPVSAVKEG